MILPFGILLAMIALGPLFFPTWWHRHYPKVALALAAVTLGYYFLGFPAAMEKAARQQIWAVGHHYVSFIALVGALFVVSGGIHIRVPGEATPLANAGFLLVGAVLANLLGTTGASMLLIRPWLRMNRRRVAAHHVVFFIFIVSNLGGSLTPIGDPPLFLGFLEGIPFWWVAEHCWPMWSAGIGLLLVMFYVVDRRNFRRSPPRVHAVPAAPERWHFSGWPNLFFLGVILAAVFINHPHFLREALMLGAAIGSFGTTKKAIHQANDFNFHPIREVAILFVGIFATMIPALNWLEANAARLGQPSPSVYYWSCGTLSSVLDNAPTYMSFLSAIEGSVNQEVIVRAQQIAQAKPLHLPPGEGADFAQVRATVAALEQYFPAQLAAGTLTEKNVKVAYLLGNLSFNAFLIAISIGSVFFGAATYIGNGPNFMVKAIAEHSQVPTPDFMGYIFKYTLPFLLPVLTVIWWFFFRG